MLFNQIDRKIIREYKGSRWNEPLIVTTYKVIKSQREIDRAIRDTFLYKFFSKILNKLS